MSGGANDHLGSTCYPKGYKKHCAKCYFAKVKPGGTMTDCARGKWDRPVMLQELTEPGILPPYYASRCRAYEPMDLEPDNLAKVN